MRKTILMTLLLITVFVSYSQTCSRPFTVNTFNEGLETCTLYVKKGAVIDSVLDVNGYITADSISGTITATTITLPDTIDFDYVSGVPTFLDSINAQSINAQSINVAENLLLGADSNIEIDAGGTGGIEIKGNGTITAQNGIADFDGIRFVSLLYIDGMFKAGSHMGFITDSAGVKDTFWLAADTTGF